LTYYMEAALVVLLWWSAAKFNDDWKDSDDAID
jgi:hypothetical protein